ncbi:hypothetical protein N8I74_07200 [Chitiniphilus purpureus]|uniref:Glycine zipper domain-containing protein n=1 Tax=Chitiniphilus purpureus TaxID=2981137 RepID=A0ABY6DR21_9NEIS|nr:hypothetical protein [Chitiniphilus sp. CD1]UXY16801.1 hypothetical protein N8I74_07200 [Chitiniphilus sp. CD1]
MAHDDYDKRDDRDANRDPISGEPGAHPVSTGVGAAVGGAAGIGAAAAAGAAAGSAVGPVGTAVGAAVGAVVGGLAGSAAGELVNPTEEEEFWRNNYAREPYVAPGSGFERYSAAYRTGYEGRGRFTDRTFDEAEGDLRDDYYARRGDSALEWDDARAAARASWERIDKRAGV